MASHKVTTTWVENNQFETDNPSNHKLTMFNTSDDNQDLVGFGPKALMLSSLAGCTGLDVVSTLKKMRVTIDDFKMEVEGDLTDEHPKTYHTVRLEYHFYGNDLDEKKINKAVDLSIEKYCGVMAMFKKFAEVQTSIHLHNK